MPSPSRTLRALSAALVLCSGATGAAAPKRFADDYPGALAEAKRLGVPLVVDVWAPW